MESKVFRQSF